MLILFSLDAEYCIIYLCECFHVCTHVVTLKSASNSLYKDFKGFMIQARVVADNSPVGSWELSSLPIRALCPAKVRKPNNNVCNGKESSHGY